MYTEGIVDLTEMIMQLVLCPPDQKEAKISLVKDKTKNRYLPAYEQVSRVLKSVNTVFPGKEKSRSWEGQGAATLTFHEPPCAAPCPQDAV